MVVKIKLKNKQGLVSYDLIKVVAMAKPEAFIRMVTTEAHISKANMVSPLNWHKFDFEFCSLAIGNTVANLHNC
jgi:flavoprotein